MSESSNIKQESLLSQTLILIKHRLSLSVVLSSVCSYLIAFNTFSLYTLSLLILGGFFVVGASNGLNQVIERRRDALMTRTSFRPLPSGTMSVNQALTICFILCALGLTMLYFVNFRTAFFGLISMIIYLALYTPLKPVTPLSVFFGAIPGAIPFMLGWVAATNNFGIEAGTLFAIQFFWQFPHFWALGWMLHDDYKKAGINMLPTKKKDKATAFQTILYTIWMIMISLLPLSGLTGDLHLSIFSAFLIGLIGLSMLYYSINLYNKMSTDAAKKLFRASVVCLTLIQVVYVIDNIYIWS